MSALKRFSAKSMLVPKFCVHLIEQIFRRERFLNSFLLILLFVLTPARQAFPADESMLEVTTLIPYTSTNLERKISDDKVIISVSDAEKKPVFGLSQDDFVVTDFGRTAKIISVQPVEESLGVPRDIVLVLDNSESMRMRYAIESLLAGVDELLKIIRPIDQVQVVFFAQKGKIKMGGRDLSVITFKSNNPAELKTFITEVYRNGITSSTVLYEGILAGLELIEALPEKKHIFLVIFSDGEDISSSYSEKEVLMAADGLKPFTAYAIDFMPGKGIDNFLRKFTEKNRGQIWKAASETNLVGIFQSVASRMLYFYEISYLFPTTGSLTVKPATFEINELESFSPASPAEGSDPSTPPKTISAMSRIEPSQLTLNTSVDSAYKIQSWKIKIANANGTLIEKDGKGTPAAEIIVPIKTNILGALAGGGDLKTTLEIIDTKGQPLVLTAPPAKIKHFRTTGSLEVAPPNLIIEEIKTIDSSPLLGHIYFQKGSSDIAPQYVLLAGPEKTTSYNEQSFRDTLEKYYQVLNIIGKRLTDHPAAIITLTGCNDNTDIERQNKKLSKARAEAIKNYFQTVWRISPDRIKTEARNLPEIPSTDRIEEGREENRRVEISADDSAILAPVRSTYLSVRIDTEALTLHPVVEAAHGVAYWTVRAADNSWQLGELSGEGAPSPEIKIPLQTSTLREVAEAEEISLTMVVTDNKNQELELAANPIKVDFIQTSQRLAEKQDFKVQEKYALILFDFDSDNISGRNQGIVNTIVARIKELPQAKVEIIGHTDIIGKESYNIKLSERRALSVYKLLAKAYEESSDQTHMAHSGVGPDNPLFDNMTPETRAFNRTVTITLEYMTGN